MKNVATALLLSVVVGCASLEELSAVGDPARGVTDPELQAVCREGWEAALRRDPLWATRVGETRFNGALPDNSPEAAANRERELAGLLARLVALDPETLTDADALTRELLLERFAVEHGILASGIDLDAWNLDARGGPQNDLLSLEQPAVTEAERAQLLERWRRIPSFLDQATSNLRRGLDEGRVASKNAVTLVIDQLETLLATPPGESPLTATQKLGDAAYQEELLTLVRDGIYPAFDRYRAVIADEVLPAARDDDQPGVSHVPGGAAYYQVAIREHTSLAMTPEEIHAVGLQEVARINAEMEALGARLFGTTTLAELAERLRSDPTLHFETAAEVKAKAIETVERATARMDGTFGIQPAAPCEVVEVPLHEAPYTTIGYYEAPDADGTRPGRYYINTYLPKTRPRYDAEVLGFHEAIPGHHLQIAISQELADLPALRRFVGDNAYVEGWALYTERLCDEMGLYTGDTDRIGMLSFDAWRACRLVVDTGLHALGWSRERAIAYMRANTLLAENNVVNEIDRYIAWPGQALGYKLGQREILRLRSKAREALGDDFRIADFHDRVLENGALPLSVLARRIDQWLAARP